MNVFLKAMGGLVRHCFDKPKELKLAQKHAIAFYSHTKDHLCLAEYSIKKSLSSKGVKLEISRNITMKFGSVLGLCHN